ncbi:MAG TPA: GGDEF domain-containing protein, partial [Stellaceae bacterium]|nr:GGDEF domain-containing protein [Stellaceae bacterium]
MASRMASRTSCFTIGDLMLLDPPTLLVTMILAILATSSSYLVIWLQDRRQHALLWMMAATLLATAAFATRVILPNGPAIIITNPVMLVAAGCLWMSCRALTAKRILPWALVIPGLIWVGLCCLPAFMAQSGVRVAVANLMIAPAYGLAARELWRLKGEAKVARWWLIGILGLQCLISLGFGLFRAVDPGPNQENYISFTTFPLMALSAQGFVLMLSFGMIALVKERAAYRDRQAASSDALTGLANRRRLDEALELAFRDARQGGKPLALIMVDADAFKAYNDLYGHLQGDACLRAIAGALRSGVVRKQDLVARYGGEEFAVLLPETDMN